MIRHLFLFCLRFIFASTKMRRLSSSLRQSVSQIKTNIVRRSRADFRTTRIKVQNQSSFENSNAILTNLKWTLNHNLLHTSNFFSLYCNFWGHCFIPDDTSEQLRDDDLELALVDTVNNNDEAPSPCHNYQRPLNFAREDANFNPQVWMWHFLGALLK